MAKAPRGTYLGDDVWLMRLMGDGWGGWRPEFKQCLSRSARYIIAQGRDSIHRWRRISVRHKHEIASVMVAYDMLQLQLSELNQEDIHQFLGGDS